MSVSAYTSAYVLTLFALDRMLKKLPKNDTHHKPSGKTMRLCMKYAIFGA